MIPISNFCDTGSGSTPSRERLNDFYGGDIPWVKSGELRQDLILDTAEHVTEAGRSAARLKIVPAGSILIAMYGATVGELSILGVPATTNQAVCHIIPDPNVADTKYLYRCLQVKKGELLSRRVGGAQPNISQLIIRETTIPLPPLDEQKRIAEVLDKADALRLKRRLALQKLDSLLQSIFLDMFGDPAINTLKWRVVPLGETAVKFSDGPFGSNLKTEHYVDEGIRVVRLQNIGIGTFADSDKVFISEEHFNSLPNNHCQTGDVLIGTMGEPNLRACLLPESIPTALNKADCILLRPRPGVANNKYLCWLLNMPSTLRLASSLVLGQTRLRISMGRLRGLEVPLPPIELQDQFSERVSSIESVLSRSDHSRQKTEHLFSSIQQTAFKGELFLDTKRTD